MPHMSNLPWLEMYFCNFIIFFCILMLLSFFLFNNKMEKSKTYWLKMLNWKW